MEDKNKDIVQIPETISYYEHQAVTARMERQIRRFFIALIISILLLFASNIAWLVYDSMFDTMSYDQDGDGLNNINTGEQGNVTTDEPKSEDKVEAQP